MQVLLGQSWTPTVVCFLLFTSNTSADSFFVFYYVEKYAKWCQVIPDLCKNGICINTQGGYRCECPKGFQLSSDSRTCEDDSRIVLEDSGVTVAIDGRSVELHWSYRLGSNLVVFEAWYHQRNGLEEMIAFRNHPSNISVSSKYEGRVKAFGDADLLLEGVSPADDGTYQLMAAFRNVTSQRKYRTLVVYYPPTTIDVPPNLNATEGDQVTIQAHANGVPPPTYVWEKVNGSLPSNSVISATTGALKLLNATLQDSGEYRVTASNQLGNVSDVTILTILTVEIRMPLVPEPYIILHNRAMSLSREEDTPPVEEGTPPVEEDTPTVEEETPTPPVKEVMNDTEKGNLNPNVADLGGTPGLTTLHVVLIAVVPSVMLLVLGVVAGILGNRWSRKRQSDDHGIEDFKEFDFHPDILELRDLHKLPPPLPPPVPARPQFLEYEVNPTDLRLNEQIGRGAFGIVFIATLKRAVNGLLTEQTVVVKTVQEDAGEEEVKNFIREVDTTINLRQHINLLGLVGCCTLSRPPYLVTEYMPYGDLKKFLLNCRKLEERLQDSMYDFDEMKIYQVARQIANGMTYISQAGYVHGDLAARNVLVGEDLVVKIADFGLATDIYERGYRRQDAEQKIPLRWMAPERLLREGRYTSKSDVWSFGVVLYEIATLGNVPYPGRERTLLEELSTGYREPRPPGLKQELYDMMLRCWQWEEDDRPEFEHLYDELDAVVEVMAKDYVKPGSGSPVGGQNEAAEAAETSYDVPKSARMGTQLKVTADVYNSEDNDKVDSLALASSNVESSSTPIERDVDTHNDIHTAVNNCRAMQQDALLESEDHGHLQVESSIPHSAVIMDTNDSFTDSELPLLTNVRTNDTQTLTEENSLDAEDEMLMSPTPEEIVH
ncbi:PREDICTED: fibroblast growth factor receptor 3-like isoform X1 [Branchiostoma belcheri]|uniref:Fibroblast growth factor receptor 3-like isoform X1 n=2 Tax=Branchiostoma belcheri TaxID=7741 RepID=A0A6P4Y997_BRABE|nr:PREDICTED: fibroblast growth factor receptor 3-like isoform X1 [Branchiostoma belcheri]